MRLPALIQVNAVAREFGKLENGELWPRELGIAE